MTALHLDALSTRPQGFDAAESLVCGIDSCFELGFSRLGPQQLETLDALSQALAATPLGPKLSEAIEGMRHAQFEVGSFEALGAARAALQGAQYDALRHQLDEASSTTAATVTMDAPGELDPELATWLRSSRAWLLELALTGFSQIEADTILPFEATLAQLQGHRDTARLATLLRGMSREMLETATVDAGVVRRWSDLWSRAMVASLGRSPAPQASEVEGTFAPLAADVRHHASAVSLVVYGLLDQQLVRTTHTCHKVDLMVGDEIWGALHQSSQALLEALDGHKALRIDGSLLYDSGDLVLAEEVTITRAGHNPLELARDSLATSTTVLPALDRHPVCLDRLLYLEGIEVKGRGHTLRVACGGEELALDMARISDAVDLGASALKQATTIVGLLRFDAGWALQPLVLGKGSKVTGYVGQGASKAKAPTATTLRERAGKLLRQKS